MASAGGLTAATAFLAACGGGSDGEEATDNSTLLSKPVDTTKVAKRTGVIKDRTHADPPTLDGIGANSPWNAVGPHIYSGLVAFKPGILKPTENEVVGDLAESWEIAPDGLTITLKLRQGVKFHNKPPINGRAMDMDDVLFSWDRFVKKGTSRTSFVNSVSPDAPVMSLTSTDSRTLVMKLKEPLVFVLGLFASNSSGYYDIVPKETESTFDPRGDMIGTGPYFLSNYQPSVSFTMKRNPDFWDKDYALADQIDMPIVPEYASALVQFKAGNTYSFGSYGSTPKITAEDVLPLKKETPAVQVFGGDLGNPQGLGTRILVYGWLPDGKSPFVDERVRQAISMSWDRDLYMDTFFNIPQFAAEGLPVDARWNTGLQAIQQGFWLDPKGKDFGPNAKYFVHDVAEAKKLLAAAGFPTGFETTSNYVTGPELPTAKHAEVIDNMISEAGIRSKVNGLDYQTVYIPKYRDARGQFEGWAYKSTAGGAGTFDPVGELANFWWSKGGTTFHGFSVSGKNDQSGDPQVDSMIEKARLERDTERRRALVFDIQRYLAKPMFALYPPGSATGFLVSWPALGNFRVFQGGRPNNGLWVDDTKAPIAKT